MARNIRTSDELYALAQYEARLQHRSLAQQIEHWAKLGMAAERKAGERVDVVQANGEATRRLDARDVQEGRRAADYTHFLPRSFVRRTRPRFHDDYSAD
jgi:hypothetical protein